MEGHPTGYSFRRAGSGILVLGLSVSLVGVWLCWRKGADVMAVACAVTGLLMVLLPLLASWEVCVDPVEKTLLIRRWWKRTRVDLQKVPARELVLMESNTEPLLYFPRIVLADGRSWTLPSEIYQDHDRLAQALKTCSPNLVVRNSTLLAEI